MNARSTLERPSEPANTYFVGLVFLASVAALTQPDPFMRTASYISPLLGLVMPGMGLTLQPVDFRRFAEHSRDVATDVLAQWPVMPTAAYALTAALLLPPELAVGVTPIDVASGGTASNVMAYLGKGGVAPSVAIMTVIMLAAPLVMLAWVVVFAGEQLQVGFVDLLLNIVQIVFIPAALGFALRAALDRDASEVVEVGFDVFPLVSVLSIVVIVAAVVGLNANTILDTGATVIGAIVLHSAIGLGTDHGIGRLAGMSADRVRTTMFEVGLQDSGLAVASALSFFSPAAALPPALFSVWYNITGPLLVSYFARTASDSAGDAPADD